MIAGAITFAPRDGTLAPQLDAAKLHEAAEPVLDDANLTTPKDARSPSWTVSRRSSPGSTG